jgi:activator of 2-hydroxyglutaryl-CoA dehydratase
LSAGKTVVKYEMKSLREAVLEPMQRIGEQTQHVQQLQNKVEKEQEVSKVLKETVSTVSKNLSLREQELQILRRRAEEQHARNKQEVLLGVMII